MEEIKVKGKVSTDIDCYFETEYRIFSYDILNGIDEILLSEDTFPLNNGDEIELIIKIKRNK